MKRIHEIEGLRGYLAFWVVISHVMGSAGYESSMLRGPLVLFKEGALAVDLFIVLSGFVIFFLLDHQKESYGVFIIRRFFRLYPVYIFLFACSIPLASLVLHNAHLAQEAGFLSPELALKRFSRITEQWTFLRVNLISHLFMVHGMIPDRIVPNGAVSFLSAAWSISLEWQFYVLAPLAFALAVSTRAWARFLLLGVCFVLFLSAQTFLPYVREGAFLPFHIQFFFLGGASYFVYKMAPRSAFLFFPVAVGVLLFWIYFGSPIAMFPVIVWIAFMALLLEKPDSIASRFVRPIFAHPWVILIGASSYSIYLSHRFIIEFSQYALFHWASSLSRFQHFAILMVLTFLGTTALSLLLYRWIEVPGNHWGRRVADAWAKRRDLRKGKTNEA